MRRCGPAAMRATGPAGSGQPRGTRVGAVSSCWMRLSIWSRRWLARCADWFADSALWAAFCTLESSWSRRELIPANSSLYVAQAPRLAVATIARPRLRAITRCRLVSFMTILLHRGVPYIAAVMYGAVDLPPPVLGHLHA